MLGYVLYGEPTERGSRKFLNVMVRKMKNGVAMCLRTDQKKFYRNTLKFEEEGLFLDQNAQILEKLLNGETIYL